jgi:dipeptidase E
MIKSGNARRILLISNSTVHGKNYLDHVQDEVIDFLGNARKIIFFPFALYDRKAYEKRAQERFGRMSFELASIHNLSNMERGIAAADAIFVGGGNTFRLLKSLYDHNLLTSIRQRVSEGVPYIGSSAGSIVACPSIKTTKDMPIVQPPSFEALGIVPFQISPHYLDPDPKSTHMGETQEERIIQFLEENSEPVVGLREGSYMRVEGGTVTLKGPHTARIFVQGEKPIEVAAGPVNHELLFPTVAPA